MTTHLEEKLQADCARIRDKVREMGDLALRGIEDSLAALLTKDTHVAYSAILRDARIDDLETTIDGMCVEFIVRHIPVAAHLRFVHSVAKIVSELERVGDYAESINRQAILLASDSTPATLDKFQQLASVAIEMLRQAVRSFLDEDLELAEKTMALDARSNALHQEIYQDLQKEVPVDSDDLERLFALLSVANRYERVADQARNICEEVYYIVTGDVVKHRLDHDVRVLFISSSNSCRSLMAEGIAKAVAGKHFEFHSGGVDASPPDPKAVEFLAKKGIDVSGHRARTLEEIGDLGRFKAVVAIGREAAAAVDKPKLAWRAIALEWEMPNPSEARGDDRAIHDAYNAVFDELLDRITELIRSLHGTVSSLDAVRAK